VRDDPAGTVVAYYLDGVLIDHSDGDHKPVNGCPSWDRRALYFLQGVTMGLLLLVVIVLLLLGAAPAWPYSRDWGYYPSGGAALLLVVVVLLLFTRVVPWGF
jgi:Protein of unknown function (DUF3309)